MAGCDGWITIKIFELLFATFCTIYKRVTDDEARKLFYFLQKYSREWPLLNNVTWEENGAIFTDVTYGGYIIIIIGLIVGQCSGELRRCRKLENFFLVTGALLFVAAGSLELAALESVEERLVDNAAILGVFSLVTGFLFIIDLLSASKRRKRETVRMIQRTTQNKITQTEEKKPAEIIRTSDVNGNIQNGRPYSPGDSQSENRIPRNAIKFLPSSPVANDNALVPATSPNNEYPTTIAYPVELPVIDGLELKTHEGRVRSTESFLRSEREFFPKLRKASQQDRSNNNFFIPAGYVLVPATQLSEKSKTKSDSGVGDSPTPPGYAKIAPDTKIKPGYVMIPIDRDESGPEDGSRKLQSPTVTTTVKSPQAFRHAEDRGPSPQSSNLQRSASNVNSSDSEEPRFDDRFKYEMKPKKLLKYPSGHFETDSKGRRYALQTEDSSDEPKPSYPGEILYKPDSRLSLRSLRYYPGGKFNGGYSDDKDNEFPSASRRSSPYRSRASSPEKPKSILRFDHGRSSKKENGLHFPKDVRYDSLDSQKIAEDLRNLREITKSDLDLTRNLEKENKVLKERLRREKEEKEKLKYDLEDRKKLEQALKESEEEKNRRISEREEQYFGIKDLKQSHKESSSETKHPASYFAKEDERATKGAREINEKLREKHLEHENKAAKEAQEFRDLIDERFHFLHEEEKSKKRKDKNENPERATAPVSAGKGGPKIRKSDSEETNLSQSTDDEIRIRVETPGSASYKSEALFWLGDREDRGKSFAPTSPASPGYVLYTAQNWPESSPEDRYNFSAKEAQRLAIAAPPKTPSSEPTKSDFLEGKKNTQKLRLPEFEEVQESPGPRKGLLVRKVDFHNEPPMEMKKPTTVAGSTSTWKKWLRPKPKLQHARSVPN